MTQAELAEGICSVKYIYLIEKNQRTPTYEILYKLKHRLHLNINELLPYSMYDDPFYINDTVKQIDQLRRTRKFDELKQFIKTLDLEDAVQPIKFEAKFSLIWIKTISNNKHMEAIREIREMIFKLSGNRYIYNIDSKNMTIEIARCYNLFALCEYLNNNVKECIDIYEQLYNYLLEWVDFPEWIDIFIDTGINYSKILVLHDSCDQSEKHLKIISEIILKNQKIDKLHLCYDIQASIYEQLNKPKEAQMALYKASVLASGYNKRTEMIQLLQKDNHKTIDYEALQKITFSDFLKHEGIEI